MYIEKQTSSANGCSIAIAVFKNFTEALMKCSEVVWTTYRYIK